jgi:hypothetical protein
MTARPTRSRTYLVGILVTSLSISCGVPFPTNLAREADTLRITMISEVQHGRASHSGLAAVGKAEITQRDVLDAVLEIVSEYDSWKTIPECFLRMDDGLRLDWLNEGKVAASMTLSAGGGTARVGEKAGPPCGKEVPDSDLRGLMRLLVLRRWEE